jgi:hypothetical protein
MFWSHLHLNLKDKDNLTRNLGNDYPVTVDYIPEEHNPV